MAHRALLLIGILLVCTLGCLVGTSGCNKEGATPAAKAGAAASSQAAGEGDEAALPAEGTRKVRTDIPLRVFAVNTFTAALPTLANRYRDTHEGRELAVTFGTPDDLLKQIRDSKSADLLIVEDPDLVRLLKEEGVITHATAFVTAQLIVITNAERPTLISVAEDLQKPENKKIAIPASTTVAGKAALGFLSERTMLNVLQPRLTEYPSVADVVKAVGAGEIPLGFAYASAIRGRKAVRSTLACGLDAPPEFIALSIAGSENEAGAEEFITILQDQTSRTALATAGFSEIPARVIY